MFLKFPKKMIFGKSKAERYNVATACHICGGEFIAAGEDIKDIKVGDRCHFSGASGGAAHSSCNLKYIKLKFYHVVFHNLSGYLSKNCGARITKR